MEKKKRKKDYSYVWLALILSLLFWVPLLNIIVFLPLAIYLSVKQIKLQKKEPEIYGRMIYPALILAHSLFSMFISILILILSTNGLI